MAETYCGKTCAECAQKETLNCPGCKAGPGRQFGCECELAKCVRDKGHETCDTCIFKGNCGMLRGRESMPDYRRRRDEAETQRKAAIARRAPALGKWLWILFWLVIPSTIGSLMTQEFMVNLAPGLYISGKILNAVVLVVYGIILLRLASEDDKYRTAGICFLISSAVSVLVTVISGTGETPPWTLLFTVPAAVVSFMAEYNECMAHAAVLTGVDNEQSEKWEKLWKWNIGLFGALLGSMIVVFILPLIAAIVMLAAAIGLVVLSILKLVYLYRTARIFKDYTDLDRT